MERLRIRAKKGGGKKVFEGNSYTLFGVLSNRRGGRERNEG